MAVSMSVTAFPVLARILGDCGLQKTPLGVIALTCAAVGDVTAWCLLAIVVGVAKATPGEAFATTALAVAFTAAMLVVVRPFVGRWILRRGPDFAGSPQALAVVCTGLLLSALATEAIGIHALFGAFLFGAVIPHDSALAHAIAGKLTDLVVVLFLPAFFAFTGMRTEIFLVEGLEDWLLCALVIIVAVAGKFGGSYAAARLTGLGWRDSAALGVMMNTRGLMELVVLNVGLDLRVISPKVFAMMVAMALVTTFATTPVLYLLGVVAPRGAPLPARLPRPAR
jgi:Kef-type K+ transport system membrane component KefB